MKKILVKEKCYFPSIKSFWATLSVNILHTRRPLRPLAKPKQNGIVGLTKLRLQRSMNLVMLLEMVF